MKFSIIIPNYNSEKWVEKCLNSILNQTFKDYEIVFVDDISEDNSLEMAKKIIGDKQAAKFIKNSTKRLNGGSRNVGIAEAEGEYILCIDCDDWLSDEKVLEDIDKKINGEDIIYLGFKIIGENYKNDVILKFKDKEQEFHNPYAAPWLKVVKRELYLKAPFPEGTLYEDRIQNYELVLNSKTFCCLGRATHCWNRTNEESISKQGDKWVTYRFEYCGELYKLIQKVKNEKIKNELIEELKMYLNSCNEMVGEL